MTTLITNLLSIPTFLLLIVIYLIIVIFGQPEEKVTMSFKTEYKNINNWYLNIIKDFK